jgi:hypothetical protein
VASGSLRPAATLLLSAVAGLMLAPAGAALAAVPSPASVTRVAILSTSQWGPDDIGLEHAVGEVQDTGTTDVDLVRIDLVFYDSSNQVLGTDVTFPTIETLIPGEKSPFEDIFSPPAGYNHYAVTSVTPQIAQSLPNHLFDTIVSGKYVDSLGDTEIVGSVANENDNDDALVNLVFTYYDSEGAAVAQDQTYLATNANSDLGPQATASFDEIADSGDPSFPRFSSYAVLVQSGTPPDPPSSVGGFWLAAADGEVFAAGSASSLGEASLDTGDAVVGIASTQGGRGYWLVTREGNVYGFGDAHFHGDLPASGIRVDDIEALTPTGDGDGYWLIGTDGGEFAFGDAKFRGSLPGLGVHVSDIAGMVATSDGEGYWIVGADGGVFAFGNATFKGSLPGLGVRVGDVRAMIASPTREGYVLVGSDGGTFVFGSGVHYFGSLPGRGIKTGNVVGLALSSDGAGYWLAGSDGNVYAFGDAGCFDLPAGISPDLAIAGIAGS